MTSALFLAAALVVLAPHHGGNDPRDSGPDRLDVSRYPAEQKARYAVFADKCSRCHPLARSINSPYGPNEWKRYLKRMIRRPNSGINEEEGQQIYGFLRYYASHHQPGRR